MYSLFSLTTTTMVAKTTDTHYFRKSLVSTLNIITSIYNPSQSFFLLLSFILCTNLSQTLSQNFREGGAVQIITGCSIPNNALLYSYLLFLIRVPLTQGDPERPSPGTASSAVDFRWTCLLSLNSNRVVGSAHFYLPSNFSSLDLCDGDFLPTLTRFMLALSHPMLHCESFPRFHQISVIYPYTLCFGEVIHLTIISI